MNTVILVGRLTNDPETKYINNEVCIVNGCIAVSREFKNKEGNYDADFINYTASRATAELIGQHLKKGVKVGFTGRWQHRSYTTNNGDTRYIDEMVVERVEFLEKIDSSGNIEPKTKVFDNNTPIDKPNDDELPF